MDLVFLYGPPAAGKLTVANEVARLAGFKVFHNHLPIDAVEPVFEFGTPAFGRTLRVMRAAVLAEAAREGVDVVFTSVYAHPEDRDYMEEMCAAVEGNGGRVCLVQLVCERDVLVERCTSPGRLTSSKLSDPAKLLDILDRFDLDTRLPGRESLRLDTTRGPAEATAEAIVAHFRLRARDSEE